MQIAKKVQWFQKELSEKNHCMSTVSNPGFYDLTGQCKQMISPWKMGVTRTSISPLNFIFIHLALCRTKLKFTDQNI